MASSKAAIEKSEQGPGKQQGPGALSNMSNGVTGIWGNLTRFLSDVRAEMRKVVAPGRKEVQSTTAVVIVTVFLFGLFFFITDAVFSRLLDQVLHRLVGQ